MEVILWGIFIITTLLGVCIMMIQENPERYNKYIVEYGIGLIWVIMYIYLLDVYFLGLYYKKFLITLIALTILFAIFSSFYYQEGRDYGKNEKIILEKEDEVETRKYLKFFYRGLNLSPALIPLNRGVSDFITALFESQFLLLIFILRFSDILLKINHIFYNILFFILLFFIEKRLLKVITRYKDYLWLRQVLRYFMFICLVVLYINCIFLSNYKNINKNNYHSEKSSEPEKNQNYSQPQQEVVKPTVVENSYIPTAEDARYINYNTYYNDYYDYSIDDYPDDDYFQISKTYEDGMRLQNDNGEILISLTSNWNPNGESL
jgi:MORN repeat protein